MKTYEYRVIDHPTFDINVMDLMNHLGSEGWKIIKISEPMKYLNSDGLFTRIYYRRTTKPTIVSQIQE